VSVRCAAATRVGGGSTPRVMSNQESPTDRSAATALACSAGRSPSM
jgi:hypothetical protein